MMCSVLNRIGGEKILYEFKKYEENFRDLCTSIKEYNTKKTDFINKEHREME